MDTPTILPILKKIPFLADLNEAEHKEIINHIILNYFPANYCFFHEGDAESGSMYIIKTGSVKITRKDASGKENEIAVLKDNDFFGEMALVTNEPRNATSISLTECEVFELKKDDFIKLVESSPALASKLSSEFLSRVKKNN